MSVTLVLHNATTKRLQADYILDKPEGLADLIGILTPKFEGKWSIILIDPKITYVKEMLDGNLVPDFVDCFVHLNNAKMENIVMDYPTLAPKTVSVKEEYKELISTLKHLMQPDAMEALYSAIGPHLSELQEALVKLDTECEEFAITRKQVVKTYNPQKRVYASEVLSAFLLRDRYRWNKLNKLVTDLGMSYAYNALYKQVVNLLKEKNKYLHNEDIKNRLAGKVDAMLIDYTYVIFSNSRNYNNLYGLMYDLDYRSKEALERIQYVNLQ